MDDENEFDEMEGLVVITPQRFSRVTLIRAGLDFLGHVFEGAACAVRQVEHAVLGHEIRMAEERNWQEAMQYDLESIPETDD